MPPQDYVPRRPQVFDGGVNRESVVPKGSVAGEPRLLYFNDPSFATGMKPTVFADGRGILRYSPLPPTEPNLRRYTNLKLQHVVSFRATKDGWSLETQDGASEDGSETSAHETRGGLTIPPTTAGATRGSEKGDATVVTLHGHGPKPPSDGRSAVSEVERNAFNEEKRILAEQRKAFEREKSKKEKELADKKQALDDREAELELRDNAADLFDLEEREMQRAERQKAKYKANTKVQRTENFNILREKKEPYEIVKQNEEGMTIKAKSKDPNIVQSHLNFEIAGKKQPFENLEKENGELFVSGKEKGSLSIKEGNHLTVLPKKKAPYKIEKQNEESMTIKRQPKPDLVYENCDAVEISAKEKEPYQNQIITSIDLRGKERVENKIESTNSINLLSLEKPENEIDFGKELTVLRAYDPEDEKLKELLLMQHLDELTVRSEPKKASNTQAIALSGAQPPYVKKRIGAPKTQKQGSREKKTLKPEQTNEVMLLASEKPANQREYGERVKILPKPKPEFKKTTLEGFTVGAVERKPYETECTDAIELAYEEPKKPKIRSLPAKVLKFRRNQAQKRTSRT